MEAAEPIAERAAPCIRLLCLGNDILADDGLGPAVAEKARDLLPDGVEIVVSPVSGMALLEEVLGVTHLLVVDTVCTGAAAPGSMHRFAEADFQALPGGSPHYVGLFDALRLGRALGFPVPDDVAILAVEAADVLTVGGPMHPDVRAAVPAVLAEASRIVRDWRA